MVGCVARTKAKQLSKTDEGELAALLYEAVTQGKTGIASQLLLQQANPNAMAPNGFSSIHIAGMHTQTHTHTHTLSAAISHQIVACKGMLETLHIMVLDPRADISIATTRTGMTTLHLLAGINKPVDPDLLLQICSCISERLETVDAPDKAGRTPLFFGIVCANKQWSRQ
jgi:hypothetical protein